MHYYKAIIIPLIITLILATALIISGYNLSSSFASEFIPYVAGNYLNLFGVYFIVGISIIFFYLVFAPFCIMVFSILFHIINKHIFRVISYGHTQSFNASIYGALPLLLFFWILIVPQLYLITYVLLIWSIIIFIFAISSYHRISKVKAFGSFWLFIIFITIIGLAGIGFSYMFL